MLSIGGIVKIFEEIEQRLVQSLKRNLSRHKDEEQEYEKNWSAWQAEKLRSLERFRRENAAIMQEYTEQIDSETRQIMQDQFDEGVNGADVPPAEPVPNLPAEIRPEPQFFGVDTTKVNKLIEDVTYLEKNAETAALRLTDDVYRQTVNRVQLAMGTGSMTLQQAIDIAVKDFLDQGINCIVYRDGRSVNIADYVRMALRTTATRAALQGKSAKYKALGYDTVQVSSYGMCSKTCEPWQGRIYIEDTFSMWDGEVKEHGGILWGKSNYCGKWFPLLSSAIEKGLFHPNCRHTILLWRDGDPLPESVDNTDSERRYKLEQQQRALEREIRKDKRKVEGFTDPENIKKAKAELRQAQMELKDFIDKINAEEGTTVLKRDEGKEKVYEGEVQPSDNENTHSIKSKKKAFVPSVNMDCVSGSKPITDQLQKELSNEYDKFTEIFGKLDNVRVVTAVPYMKNGVWGEYSDNSNELFLFGIGGEDGKNVMSKTAKNMFKEGSWSTNSMYHAYRHELGHAWQKKLSQSDTLFSQKIEKINKMRDDLNARINLELDEMIAQNLTDDAEDAIIKLRKKYLSDYGLDPENDIDEFISECIAEYSNGSPRKTSRETVNILMSKEL